MKLMYIIFVIVSIQLSGCASDWKIHGGPSECIKMCANWDLEFTAMVGVGNQDPSGKGATACVCQPKGTTKNVSANDAVAPVTSLAAPITTAEVAAAQAAYMAQQQHRQKQIQQ